MKTFFASKTLTSKLLWNSSYNSEIKTKDQRLKLLTSVIQGKSKIFKV